MRAASAATGLADLALVALAFEGRVLAVGVLAAVFLACAVARADLVGARGRDFAALAFVVAFAVRVFPAAAGFVVTFPTVAFAAAFFDAALAEVLTNAPLTIAPLAVVDLLVVVLLGICLAAGLRADVALDVTPRRLDGAFAADLRAGAFAVAFFAVFATVFAGAFFCVVLAAAVLAGAFVTDAFFEAAFCADAVLSDTFLAPTRPAVRPLAGGALAASFAPDDARVLAVALAASASVAREPRLASARTAFLDGGLAVIFDPAFAAEVFADDVFAAVGLAMRAMSRSSFRIQRFTWRFP